MSDSLVAIVVGGGARVWDDLHAAERFCSEQRLSPAYFATNDMIAVLDRPMTAVTLHPENLNRWMQQRHDNRLTAPDAVYAHDGAIHNSHITHHLTDWGGSVGMFAYVVARSRGHDRVILCGVPMTTDQQHFVRKQPWKAATVFMQAWQRRKNEMVPYCRSVSGGLTEEMFGAPVADCCTSQCRCAARRLHRGWCRS